MSTLSTEDKNFGHLPHIGCIAASGKAWILCFIIVDVYLCHYTVADDGQTPDRICAITGPPDKVNQAVGMIHELLDNATVRTQYCYCQLYIIGITKWFSCTKEYM